MKRKTTDKALKQAFRLVSASYCELCRTIDAEAKAVPHEQRAEILKRHLVKFLGV